MINPTATTVSFTVTSIEYNEARTIVDFSMGTVGGAAHMGESGQLCFVGNSPTGLTPGHIVTITIEDTGKRRSP